MRPCRSSMLPTTQPLVSAAALSTAWLRAPCPWSCRCRQLAGSSRSIVAAAALAEPLAEPLPSLPSTSTQTVFSSRAKISDHCLPWLRNARTRSNKDKNFDLSELYTNDYCSVHLAVHRSTAERLIIKRFDKAALAARPDLAAKVKLEWDIHCSLNHPHIVKAYLGMEDAAAVGIYMEYAGDSDAYAYINDKQRLALREADARQLVADVLAALSYCHALGVVHRDIKSENVFRTPDGLWKLGDFGSALRLGPSSGAAAAAGQAAAATAAAAAAARALSKQPLKLEGTFSFAAPEYVAIWRGFSKPQLLAATSYKLDSWSVGALAYDVLCGRAPFATHEGIDRATEGHAILTQEPSYPSGLSYEAVSFMRQALEKDPQKRPSVQQLLLHPWFDGLPLRPGGLLPEPLQRLEVASRSRSSRSRSAQTVGELL